MFLVLFLVALKKNQEIIDTFYNPKSIIDCRYFLEIVLFSFNATLNEFYFSLIAILAAKHPVFHCQL